MKLPKLAIENHQFTIVVIILLVLAGVASFLTMPRSEDPQISRAGSNIIAVYPGANPLDLEELVLDPIETALNELEDIDKMNSNVIDGLMLIRLEFLAGSDPDDKYGEVVQKIGSIRDELPDELSSLIIDRWEVSRVNILQVALVSDSASYRDLEWHAERLKKELERAAGVKRVNTWAFPEQEIRVALNWQKMARLGIPLGQVIGAVQSAGGNIPGGSIDIGSRRFAIQTSGSYRNLEDIAHTVVHAAGGKVLYLKDIATVNRDYEDQNYYARFNQKRAVFITANQQEGTNIYDVMEGLKSRIAAYEGSLPKEIALAYVFDQSHSVSERVNGFFANLMQGVLLVGVIVLLAMSMRAALIVMMVIPTSILIGLGLVDFSQYGLEQMSIAGLVIALGLLVDNAIVVTENVSRFLAQG
ncbi:MAG: efflux RND transporter permease subunit, partial [Calditrichaeota bacterium]|nr:efflux RND transporter permease subunit [Calditrichota bacterium]